MLCYSGYMSHLSHGRGIFHEEVPVIDELFCQLVVNAVEDSITKACHVALQMSDTSKVISHNITKCHRQSYELFENHPNSSNKSTWLLRGSTLNNQNRGRKGSHPKALHPMTAPRCHPAKAELAQRRVDPHPVTMEPIPEGTVLENGPAKNSRVMWVKISLQISCVPELSASRD